MSIAGNQSWGHSISPDLYHWKNEPIALFPINSSSYIFTGSIVVDPNNTSGFFPDQNNGVVAVFTIDTEDPIMLESQALAYSKDNGYTFEMYEANPVLDIGSSQFRDPKVLWYNDHWVMVVSYAQDFTVGIFTSPDLKNWSHASNFSHSGLLGLQYECPNLVEVPVEGTNDTMFLLLISINPGAPQGGSAMQYFVGDFDGYIFTTINGVTRLTDFAKDSYAGQFFSNLAPGEAVSIDWASNWEYAQDVPTGLLENWRSANTLPRTHVIREVERLGYIDATVPYDLSPVIGGCLTQQAFSNGSFDVDFSNVSSNAIYLNISITGIPPSANITSGTLNYTFSSPVSGETLRSGFYFYNDNYFFIDRGGVQGYDNPFFSDKFASNSLLSGSSWTMEAVIDRSLYEVFLDGGAQSATVSFFPRSPLTRMNLQTSELPVGVSVNAQVYALDSVWTS